jgi:hypothetical protein
MAAKKAAFRRIDRIDFRPSLVQERQTKAHLAWGDDPGNDGAHKGGGQESHCFPALRAACRVPRFMPTSRAALLCIALVGCGGGAASVAGPAPEPASLYEQARKAHEAPASLICDAKAFVKAPRDSGRYELHVAAERPDSLRIEALTPVGDPAAVLVASKGRFSLMDLRNGVFYRGPATATNLARLLPVAARPEELVAILTGAIPDLEGGQPAASRRQAGGSELTVSGPDGSERVVLGNDLRVRQIERSGRGGQLLWTVKLDQYDDAAAVATLVQFEAPAANTKVDLRLRNLTAGKPPPGAAFQLAVPQGARVEEVQ